MAMPAPSSLSGTSFGVWMVAKIGGAKPCARPAPLACSSSHSWCASVAGRIADRQRRDLARAERTVVARRHRRRTAGSRSLSAAQVSSMVRRSRGSAPPCRRPEQHRVAVAVDVVVEHRRDAIAGVRLEILRRADQAGLFEVEPDERDPPAEPLAPQRRRGVHQHHARGAVVHRAVAERLSAHPLGVVVGAHHDLLGAVADRHDDVAAARARIRRLVRAGGRRLVERERLDGEGQVPALEQRRERVEPRVVVGGGRRACGRRRPGRRVATAPARDLRQRHAGPEGSMHPHAGDYGPAPSSQGATQRKLAASSMLPVPV